jgi:hypothetical protein
MRTSLTIAFDLYELACDENIAIGKIQNAGAAMLPCPVPQRIRVYQHLSLQSVEKAYQEAVLNAAIYTQGHK